MAEIHHRPTSHDALMAAEYLIATSESLAEARLKDDVGDGGSHEVDRRKATEDERREKGRKRERVRYEKKFREKEVKEEKEKRAGKKSEIYGLSIDLSFKVYGQMKKWSQRIWINN